MRIQMITGTTAVAAVALLAGCGGSSKPPAGSASSNNNPVQAAYQFSRCMRQHGLPNFPDPQVQSSAGHTAVAIRVGGPDLKGSPAFRTAQQACQHILPGPQNATPQQQHAREAGLLSFARCMRSHGVSSFPDPTAQGDITQEMLASAGVNVHSLYIQQAATACIPASHGLLTQAALQRAENGQ